MRRILFSLLLFIPVYSYSQLSETIFSQQNENGLTAIVIENSSVPLVTVEWVVRDGIAYEPKNLKGYSSLVQKLFFAANKDFPSASLMKQKLKQLGAVYGTTQSEEHSSVYLTCSKRNLDAALKLFLSALKEPLYLSDEVDSALVKVFDEQASLQGDPFFLFDQKLNQNLWLTASERKDGMVTAKLAQTTSPENLSEYQKLFYSPNNSCLIISGDVQHKDVLTKVNLLFSSLTKNPDLPADKYGVPDYRTNNYSSQFVFENAMAQSPAFVISFPVPDLRENLYNFLTGKMVEALVNAASSSLNKNLVETGLAYQVSARYREMKFGSSFDFIISPKSDKLQECYKKAREEIQSLANFNSYTTEQITQASQLLYSDYSFNTAKTTSLSHYVGSYWAKTNELPELNIEASLQEIKSLNKVINFCQLYFSQQSFTAGLLISQADKNNVNSATGFCETYPVSNYRISFTRNDDQIFDPVNKQMVNSLSQFFQINPELKFELLASQDAVERKETAKARFVATYKALQKAGAPEKTLDEMQVSIYIKHSETDAELNENMVIKFKVIQ